MNMTLKELLLKKNRLTEVRNKRLDDLGEALLEHLRIIALIEPDKTKLLEVEDNIKRLDLSVTKLNKRLTSLNKTIKDMT